MTYVLTKKEAREVTLEARYSIIKKTSHDANETKDCTVKALAMCCNLPYNYAHDILKRAGRKNRRGIPSRAVFDMEEGCSKVLEFYGKIFKVTRYARPKMSVTKFSEVKNKGIYYVIIPSHAYAQIDGQIFNQYKNKQFIKYFFEIKPLQ